MEQQHHVDRGLTALKPLVGTVISEGEWLAVSTEGFSEQQRGRPLTHLVKELVQNALDSVGSVGRIDLEFRPKGPRTAFVRCADDGPRRLFPHLLASWPGYDLAPLEEATMLGEPPPGSRPALLQRLRSVIQGRR